MRFSVAAAIACLSVVGMSAADDVKAAIRRSTDIPAQGLGPALQMLAKEHGFQIVYVSDEVNSLRTQGAAGELTSDEALTRILFGTGLTFRSFGDNAVSIVPVAASVAPPSDATSTDRFRESAGWFPRLRLAQIEERSRAASPSAQGAEASEGNQQGFSALEEVIVTAQKREERLQDVPMSIAVIGGQDIDRRGLSGMQDYLRSIPSVNQIDNGALSNAIVIRGITTSPQFENFASGTTVATYFGETPITAAGGLGAGGIDVRPVDIDRIEVLRGPQGTSYGSASLGGALRIIPNQPELERFGAHAAANWSSTSGFGGSNSMVQGVANLPIVQDTFGVRLVGYRYDDSGYHRNIVGLDPASLAIADGFGQRADIEGYRQEDVGHMVSSGGRLAALWRPSANLSIALNAMTQTIEQDGSPVTTTSSFEQARFPVAPQGRVRGQRGEVADADIDLASGLLSYDFGWASLTSVVSWVDSGSSVAETVNFSNTASTTAPSSFQSFTAETRLASALDGRFQYLAGVFYEDVQNDYLQTLVWPGTDATNPFGTNPGYVYDESRELDQRAVFGEISYDLTDKFTARAGGRFFEYRKDERVLAEGGVYGVPFDAGVASVLTSDESDSSYKLSLSYKPTEHSHLYASWSDGFRLGRPTAGLPPQTCDTNQDGLVDGSSVSIESTRTIKPDFVDNYEIGGKFEFFERRLLLDAALFYIDWNGLPVRTRAAACARSYTANVGSATSKGAELQIGWLPTASVRLDFGASYTDAELTEDAPLLNAVSGARLPGSSKLTANLSAQYETTIAGYQAFFRADSLYAGEFFGDFAESATLRAGDYAKVDVRAGVSLRNFDVELFVRNVTNEDAYTWRTTMAATVVGYQLRPRTVGIHIGYDFK